MNYIEFAAAMIVNAAKCPETGPMAFAGSYQTIAMKIEAEFGLPPWLLARDLRKGLNTSIGLFASADAAGELGINLMP